MINFQDIYTHVVGRLKQELPEGLYYHGLHHTLHVLESARLIAREEGISGHELLLLEIAVLYHDIGFLVSYKGHEHIGCEMVRAELPQFGVPAPEIELICGMIMASELPQSPHTHLERILADADLEYLGTDRYYEISQLLYNELKHHFDIADEKEWLQIQIEFLSNHRYHTEFCINNRERMKQQHLAEIQREAGM